MLRVLCLVLFFLVFQSPAFANKCHDIESLSWLVGDWEYKGDKLKLSESWQQVSASTLEGIGQTKSLETNELLSAETLRLVEMSGEVFYVAKVASNELPISFKLTRCNSKELVFENLTHDFPQKIIYQLIDEDKIKALVSGVKDEGFEINYIRASASGPLGLFGIAFNLSATF